jgi:endoglucanase
MRIQTRFLLLIAVFLPLVGAQAQSDNSIAFQRAQHLQHGINTAMWFAQANDYSAERLETFTTEKDIALIEAVGFDHCRLSIDAGPLEAWQRAGSETPFMNELDKAVRMMLAHHLSVIIDIHPSSEYKAELFQGSAGVGRFVSLWRALATHFAPMDADHVFFEIMNEPEQNDVYRWQGIQSAVVDAIRQVAPGNTIIAGGGHWSGLGDLMTLEPLADANVIYTFHDYEPMAFTHQGATWANQEVWPERAIPYPSSPEAIAAKLSEEPNLAGQLFLDTYGEDRWDAARVENTIAFRSALVGDASCARVLRGVRCVPDLLSAGSTGAVAARYARGVREESHWLGDVGLSDGFWRSDEGEWRDDSRCAGAGGAGTGERQPLDFSG